MTRKTGAIITVVVAVLTLCCSTACCATGIWAVVTGGQELGDIPGGPYAGIPVICLGVLAWVVPLLLWLFLVRGREDTAV